MFCPTRTCPPWQPRLATRIETPARTFTFPARAVVSANGRYATLYGLSSGSILQLVDLESGVVTEPGRQLGGAGNVVADDGTALVWRSPAAQRYRGTQVWVGDAVAGVTRRLFTETEGIVDQTIAGDGRAVIAVTTWARLLSIDTSSGAVRELLGSPGPELLLFQAVPGSYNEVAGNFPDGPPEVLAGKTAAVVLGPSPRGYAIQIPWETPMPPSYPEVIVRGVEPVWERLVGGVVSRHPAILPIGPTGPVGPLGMLGSYSSDVNYGIREDWSGPVNADNPARPGEIVHFFGTGWGAVDGVVQTGQPTPSDRPYRLVEVCDWRAGGTVSTPLEALRPFEVLFAGLAPGLVGVYQIDLRIPADWNEGAFRGYCLLSTGGSTVYSGLPGLAVRP